MELIGPKENKYLGTFRIMEDSNYVGTVMLMNESPNKISIWSFEIFEQYRNKKYGYNAIKEIIRLFPNKMFWLYVVKENTIAFNLYKKLGFEIEKEYSYKYDMILKQT